MLSLLIPLILTIVIEVLVLIALREYRIKVLLACMAMNVLTNIPLNLYIQYIDYSLMVVIVGEFLVFLIEALLYRIVVKWRPALTYSALCNAVSYFTGILIISILEFIL